MDSISKTWQVFQRYLGAGAAKNVSALIMAQVVSRSMSLIYVAILARYVGPEGIGRISTATAFNGLLILMVAPGLPQILVRDVASDHSRGMSYLSNMLLIRGLLGAVFVLCAAALAMLLGYPTDTLVVIVIYSVVYFFTALDEIISAMFQAHEKMEWDAAAQVVQAMLNVSLSLAAIFSGMSLFAICIASAIAVAGKVAFMFFGLRRLVSLRVSINWGEAMLLLAKSLPFGLLLILFLLKNNLGTLIVSLHEPEEVVGVYAAAASVIAIVLFVPNAVGQSIFPVFSRLAASSKLDLRSFFQVVYKYLTVMGFFLGMCTIVFAERAIHLVYGSDFDGAVTVLGVMALFLFTMAGYSNGSLLKALGRQKFLIWTEAAAIAGNALLCLALVPTWGALGVAIAFVAAGFFTYVVHSLAAHRYAEAPLPWTTIAKALLATGIAGGSSSVVLGLPEPWDYAALLVAPIVFLVALRLLGIVGKSDFLILAGSGDGGRAPNERGQKHIISEPEGLA